MRLRSGKRVCVTFIALIVVVTESLQIYVFTVGGNDCYVKIHPVLEEDV